MMKDLLHTEGPVLRFLDKIGQIILLSILWLLGSLPIVTMAGASAALYYAVVKSIRRGQGNAAKEFYKSYRSHFGRGMIATATVCILFTAGICMLHVTQSPYLAGVIRISLILLLLASVFLAPVLSRFRLNPGGIWKLSLAMSFRFPHYALLLLAGTLILILMQIYVLPIPTVLILPGTWCFLASFPMEKILLQYMPGKETTSDSWYYEN